MKKIDKFDALKGLGLAAAGLSFAVGLLSDFVEDKKIDKKVAEKVNQAMAQLTGKKD